MEANVFAIPNIPPHSVFKVRCRDSVRDLEHVKRLRNTTIRELERCGVVDPRVIILDAGIDLDLIGDHELLTCGLIRIPNDVT